jgi:uncharacterized protein with HEPN domain
MSKRPIRLLLEDIRDAVGKVKRYTQGISRDAFMADERTADAVVRNLEIIGEASSRLPKEFRDTHSNIEWAQIIGLRHRIVHDYFGIDLEMVWEILQNGLPNFRQQLETILLQLRD